MFVISGAAKGADSLGAQWAMDRSIKIDLSLVTRGRLGLDMGIPRTRRNEQMIVRKATIILAFPADPIETFKRNKKYD